MSRYDTNESEPILTDGRGRPFPRVPASPPPGAPVEDIITFLRAWNARADAIASCAHKAFDDAFKDSIGVKSRRRSPPFSVDTWLAQLTPEIRAVFDDRYN